MWTGWPKPFGRPKVFIKYSNVMKDVCSSIEIYNPKIWIKFLQVLDEMIIDIINNEKLHPVATELLVVEN